MAPGCDKIEIIRPAKGRKFACAIFDFDGTLSLIRQGWQDVMIPMVLEILRPLAHGLDEAALEELAREDVTSLTGEQTIYQMIRLGERVRQFGGMPADPLEYKRQYNTRLMARIAHRRRDLAAEVPDADGEAAVDRVAPRQDHQLRAALPGLREGHPRPQAVAPRPVAAACDAARAHRHGLIPPGCTGHLRRRVWWP